MATQPTQAESVAIPKRLPLVLEPENRDESTDKDAKLVNGYMERSRDGKEYWIYKRPGLKQIGDAHVGAGLGVYNWQGTIYAIFGQEPVLFRPPYGRISRPLADAIRVEFPNYRIVGWDRHDEKDSYTPTDLATIVTNAAGQSYSNMAADYATYSTMTATSKTYGTLSQEV